MPTASIGANTPRVWSGTSLWKEQEALRMSGGSLVICGRGGEEWLRQSGATRVIMYPAYKDRDLLTELLGCAMESAIAYSSGRPQPDFSWHLWKVLISETLVKEVSKDAGLHLPLKTLMVTLGDKEELARLIQERTGSSGKPELGLGHEVLRPKP